MRGKPMHLCMHSCLQIRMITPVAIQSPRWQRMGQLSGGLWILQGPNRQCGQGAHLGCRPALGEMETNKVYVL